MQSVVSVWESFAVVLCTWSFANCLASSSFSKKAFKDTSHINKNGRYIFPTLCHEKKNMINTQITEIKWESLQATLHTSYLKGNIRLNFL